ncbi:MAG: serine/threonine-protein phosphatase [Phycisphaera sp.]|nr:serine/threonine-protein phosphatase [Phycisphaera sp.]
MIPDPDFTTTKTANATTWRSRPVDLRSEPRLTDLIDTLSALSRVTRPEEVMPLVRRDPFFAVPVDGLLSLSTRDLEPGRYRITRLAVDSLDGLQRPVDTWSGRHDVPVHDTGFLSDVVRTGEVSLHRDLDIPDDPVLGESLRRFRSAIAIPLLDDGEARNWVVYFKENAEGMSIEELAERTLRSNLMGGTVRQLRAKQEVRAANEAMHREVERIATIQRSFMPRTVPEISGWSLAGRFETSDVAGGDLWTVRSLEDGRVAILVADASGHGPAAAVMAAMTHAVFHSADCVDLDPPSMGRRINAYLARWQTTGDFVTAILAILDPATGTFRYIRCGHPPAMLRTTGDSNGPRIGRLDLVGGPPLGIIETLEFEAAEIVIEPDETLVLFSDGILEARAPDGSMLGVEGIEAAMLQCPGDAGCTLDRIERKVLEFEGDRPREDDQTLVVLHRTPADA